MSIHNRVSGQTDHTPSSTRIQDSFNGTGISLFQHIISAASGTQVVFIPDNTEASATHLPDAVNQRYTKESVRNVDTDVVILALMAVQRLNVDELWFHLTPG